MAKSIPLTRGCCALVDDEDYEALVAHRWVTFRKGNLFYAGRNARQPDGSRKYQFMHRIILDAPAGLQVDHVNHDGLDNRRVNLRLAPGSLNHANARPIPNRTSPYKGVSWGRAHGKWTASIRIDGRSRNLGSFDYEWDAARVYDDAAREAWGAYAYQNFPAG